MDDDGHQWSAISRPCETLFDTCSEPATCSAISKAGRNGFAGPPDRAGLNIYKNECMYEKIGYQLPPEIRYNR